MKKMIMFKLQMFNTFLTMTEIAERACLRLYENLVMPELVYKEPSLEGLFGNKGLVVNVKKPATFTAQTFSTSISPEAITESYVPVTLDTIKDVSVEVTSKEMTSNIDDFQYQVIDGAIPALAQAIQNDILGLYKDVYNYVGTSGTTPDGLDDFANAAAALTTALAPEDMRSAVFNPAAIAKFRQIPSLVNAEKSGTTEALRRGSIGDVYGLSSYQVQTVKTHTAGGYAALADVTAAGTAGASTVVLTSAAGVSTAKLERGDLLTISGYNYVVTAQTAAAVAGVVTASIAPALVTSPSSTAVTFPDGAATAKASVRNLAFHRNAFALVTKPMYLPSGADAAYAEYNGIAIRVVKQYDITTKKETISFDVLYGVKTLDARLACVILG